LFVARERTEGEIRVALMFFFFFFFFFFCFNFGGAFLAV
jgi:hypothetical protein